MTLDDVNQRLADIEKASDDDERAHTFEDALRADVLEAIANGAENPRQLAALVLTSKLIEFARWCA